MLSFGIDESKKGGQLDLVYDWFNKMYTLHKMMTILIWLLKSTFEFKNGWDVVCFQNEGW